MTMFEIYSERKKDLDLFVTDEERTEEELHILIHGFPCWLILVAFADPIICNRLASVAGPRGSGWVQATKEIVIKRLLPLPCTALHYLALPYTAQYTGTPRAAE